MPDTKPGVWLDDRGFCNACRAKEIKSNIDWDARYKDLEAIVDTIKKTEHSFYDCIVPVSGGKDSWYQAAMLAENFGLKVLCVTLGAHLPTTEGIENLNNIVIYPNPTYDEITISFDNFNGNIQTEVFDLIGNRIKVTKETTISLRNYSKGIYILKVAYGDRVEELKVIKE